MDNDNLSKLALEAIAQMPTAEEIEAQSNRPYPTPACYAEFEKAAKEALRERLEKGGANPICSRRLGETAQEFNDDARLVLDDKPFYPSDMICMLLAGGILSVPTAQKAAETSAIRLTPRWLQRAIVYRNLADGDIEAAKAAADSPILGEDAWVGWRAIGEYHAAHADVESFLSLWPKYNAGQERNWMDTMRRALVDAVSRKQGWREAVALTKNKKIGAKSHVNGMIYVALFPLAQTGDTAALHNIFATEKSLADLGEFARIQLLIDAMKAATPKRPETDHPELDAVITRIIAIDPTVSKQQSRHRDWLLLDCWPLLGEQATLKRVRAAIRAPIYKRELKRLPKEGSIG